MIPSQLIERKRDGHTLSADELSGFLHGYLAGEVEEYQMSAFLMAVVFRGLDPVELSTMLEAMIGSGARLDLDHLDGPRVDKHSTGGVGDKVSLPLAPLAAALGVYVPMMSGRGLGHTGGTLDKLEAIPGFRTRLPLDRFVEVLERVGCAMIGQTAEIAPLDRRLYDLRSVTGTVPCIPLISTSIMSKKLAEGLNGLVLDVKVGEGAFLPDIDRARELARTMVELGERAGVRTTARLTAMDRPLGRAIGNALEVAESIDCLRGRGPADLRELTIELAAEMALAGGVESALPAAREKAAAALDDGGAWEVFLRMVEAQGGEVSWVEDVDRHREAPERETVVAPRSGIVSRIASRPLGLAVVAMGGGRTRLGEEIDPRVGFELAVEPGRAVEAGEPLAVVHAADAGGLRRGCQAILASVEIGETVSETLPLLGERITVDQAGG